VAHKQPKKSLLICTRLSLRIMEPNKSLVIVQLLSLVLLLNSNLLCKLSQQSTDQPETPSFSHHFRPSLLTSSISLLANSSQVWCSSNRKRSFASLRNLQWTDRVILSLSLLVFQTVVLCLRMTQTLHTLSAKMVKNLKVVSKRKKNLFVFWRSN